VGSQYRSGIFFHDAEQEKIAKDVTEKVNKQWWKGSVATEVLPAGQWWDAETYHQLYLDKSKCTPCLKDSGWLLMLNRSVWLRVPVTFPAQLSCASGLNGACMWDGFYRLYE